MVVFFNQRESSHTRKHPPGEAERKTGSDLAEKLSNESKFCGSKVLQASVNPLQAIVNSGVMSWALVSNCNSQLLNPRQII